MRRFGNFTYMKPSRKIQRKLEARQVEPYDYSNEVTDEHFSQITALVDQEQFDDWDNCGDQGGHPVPADLPRPKRFGAGDTAAGWPRARN